MKPLFLFCLSLSLLGCSAREPRTAASRPVPDTPPARNTTHPDDGISQPILELIKVPNAPETARHIDAFRSLKRAMTMADVVRQCGPPDLDVGSGFYIFIYNLDDGSTVRVETGDLKRLLCVIHDEKSGKRESLLVPEE